MNQNPFIRGYEGLHIRKEVMITHEEDVQPTYCQLAADHEGHDDDQVIGATCCHSDTHAYIAEPEELTEALQELYPTFGQIRAIVYAIRAVEDGKQIILGDAESLERAQALIDRIQFQTTYYSRTFEICSAHIPETEWDELLDLVSEPGTDFPGCETFTLPNSDAIGFKLHELPWTDANLTELTGSDLKALQAQMHDEGLPNELIRLLGLAGQADVRILILDPHAAVVPGLKLFD